MKHLRKGSIAFWRYDLPGKHLLSGRVEKVSGRSYPGPGHAMIEGYGGALWFKPLFCLPCKLGEEAQSAMEKAEVVYGRAVGGANDDYSRAIKAILPNGIEL